MMKFLRLIVLAAAAVCASTIASAQPRISYLLPDLGTTRFATYVEFIGPASVEGNFGNDGFYLNNAGDAVRVRCARPADTNLVKIGPAVVSWRGRMVSTHIFVLPTVAPNSDQWDQLQPQFRIPVVVEVNGQVSNADTFYIVRPFAFGDRRTDGNRVLGETTLGRRSRRGAMIVDSMVLAANASYNVSTLDCDPSTPGNQGLLPFTLLAVRNISGSNGTEIHADANGIDGGPGGGGGGGPYANFALGSSNRGGRGGNGFTGGGPGGYNNNNIPLAPSNEKQKPGIGSGEDLAKNNANTTGSASLNGLGGGKSSGNYENAGGGTGHPFAQSGDACVDRNTCDLPGGYGGGTGVREGERGGGGGFGTAGESATNRQNGGKVHGNDCLVPLAGGSGGASGNPSGTDFASAGGGGGGAVSIHGERLANFDVFARGDSPSAQDTRGGAGSGGGVILGMRLDNTGFGFVSSQIGSRQGPGFLEGGRGRARYDARVPNSSSYYVGPLTDTLTASLRDVSLTGDGDGSDLFIYVKGLNGPWIVIDTVTGYTGLWRSNFRLPGSDTVYFVAVGQQIAIPNRTQYVHDPGVVLSQSAWNIIRLFGPPQLRAPSTVDLGVFKCPGDLVLDTITITNLGESPLEINNPTWTGDPGFRIVSPTIFPDTIITNSSKQYIIGYTAPIGIQGVQNGRLLLEHNDTTGPARPWPIDVRVDVRPYNVEYVWRGITGDTIDLGFLCLGTPLVDQVTVTNIGLDPVLLDSYQTGDPSLLTVSANLPFQVDPTLSRNLGLNFTARRIGPAIVPTFLYIDGCSQPDTLWVRFEGVASQITLIGSGQFGNVVVGTSREIVLEVRNDGSCDLDIPTIPPVIPPFRLVSATPPPPTILRPGTSMFLRYEFTPMVNGPATQSFYLRSIAFERSCADSVPIILVGNGISAKVVADPGSLNFAAITSCERDTLSLVIKNDGTVDVTLLYPAFINGADAPDFSVLTQPRADTVIPPGGSAIYEVVFSPSSSVNANRSAILNVRTDAVGASEVNVPLNGRRIAIDVQGPRIIDLGLIPVGTASSSTATYTNATGVAVTVSRVTSSTTQVTPAPNTFTMAVAATQDVVVTVIPNSEGAGEDTLWFATDDPCADSFSVIVRWTAETGDLSVQNALPFGVLSNCEQRRDSVIVANTGSVPVDLIDVVINGTDASLFTLEDPAVVTNVTLDVGDSAILYVIFDPRGSTDGLKTAEITIRARINNQPTPFITQVTGTRRTTIPSAPGSVAFGLVDIATTSAQTVTIVNTGADPVRVSRIYVLGTSGGMFAVTPPGLPVTLQPSERIDLRVEFTPADKIAYVDTLLVEFDQPCADVSPIPLSGTGRLNVEIAIYMPKMNIDPTDDDSRLPITARIVTGSATTATVDLTMSIMIDGPVFVARSLSTGTITRNEVVGGFTEIECSLPNVTIGATEGTLVEIIGQATIGPVDSATIDLVAATALSQGAPMNVRLYDGVLRLEICQEGGPRLVTRSGWLGITVAPQPADEQMQITCHVYEVGPHLVEILDATGQVIFDEWWNHAQGDPPKVFEVDTRSFGSGVYVIRLSTPTRQKSTTALIVH